VLIRLLKLRATCAFRFTCKHITANTSLHVTFADVCESERFQTAKVILKVTAVGVIRQAT